VEEEGSLGVGVAVVGDEVAEEVKRQADLDLIDDSTVLDLQTTMSRKALDQNQNLRLKTQ
jgi:hypothetical protein